MRPSAGTSSATNAQHVVAQIFNLLYRRFLIDSAPKRTGARQVANLRYSRLKICATTCCAFVAELVPALGL
ncbi:MAG: hypothetical protein ACREIC_33960, partial [Limisphaerales bacterium]